ncbi:MAG: hypothetical protein Q4F57_05730 [Weeksellaceae bacterium]|nr:hypothetical protein [Weeksellaceae bacterium]
MKSLHNELQNLITGNEQEGNGGKLRKTQSFLRRNAQAVRETQPSQQIHRKEEETQLKQFADRENLYFPEIIQEKNFISEGAEQRVYRYDEGHVIKVNSGVYYTSWLDYFNNLLLHNYFFPSTAYQFMGFLQQDDSLYSVVKQGFIVATELLDLKAVQTLLEYNNFRLLRNHDYINEKLGIILEDLHDENIISRNNIPYFIDTVFYLMPPLGTTVPKLGNSSNTQS